MFKILFHDKRTNALRLLATEEKGIKYHIHSLSPYNTQNYNRYSYVLNNPLSLTDPTGYFYGEADMMHAILMDSTMGNNHMMSINSWLGYYNSLELKKNAELQEKILKLLADDDEKGGSGKGSGDGAQSGGESSANAQSGDESNPQTVKDSGGNNSAEGVLNKSLRDNIRKDKNGNLVIDVSVGAEAGQESYRDLLVKKISGTWKGKGGCFLGFSCDPALTKTLIVKAIAVDGTGDITVYSRETMASLSVNPRKWENTSYCSGACAATGGNRIHIGSTSMRPEAYLHELFHNFGHLGHTNGMMGRSSGEINASNIQYLENLYGL